MSETNNGFNGYYNRIQSLLTTIPSNLRSINISWIRSLRSGSNGSSDSVVAQNPLPDSGGPGDSRTRRESTHSLFSSPNSSSQTASPTQSPTTGAQHLSRPPHSHLYRHSSHYPLMFGSYNNWSLSRDNRLIPNLNNNQINVEKDRNVLSAIMSIVVIATLATALAQPKWFSINGGVCSRKYIGLQEFFYVTNFNSHHLIPDKATDPNKHHKSEDKTITPEPTSHKILVYPGLKDCVTPEIVTLQRTIIGLCFFAILFNLIQFFFDTLGVHRKWLNSIRAHALGNILAVLLCVVIIGVSYLVSNLLEKEQRRLMKEKRGGEEVHHIEIKFELSYYLVTFSGLLAIIAAASNLLRRPQHYYVDPTDAFWTDDIDEELTTSSTATSPNWTPFSTSHTVPFNTTIPSAPPPHPSVAPLPPPPPYSP